MKLLMHHVKEFWYKTYGKTLDGVETVEKEDKITEALLVFLHTEKEDEENKNKVTNKAIKNVKWLINKLSVKNVVLHAFAHLSTSKSAPEFGQDVIKDITTKLENIGLNVHLTPFGYFLEYSMHVYGESLAKVFKSI